MYMGGCLSSPPKPTMALSSINPQDWIQIPSTNITAIPDNSSRLGYIPIPPFSINFSFCTWIALKASSQSAKPKWRLAGSLYRLINGFYSPSSSPEDLISTEDSKSLILNRSQLFFFPGSGEDSWYIVFEPAYWLKDIKLQAWKYTAPGDPLRTPNNTF